MAANPAGIDTAKASEVAAVLHTTEGGLAQMRHRGTGPKFCKIGPRKVLYLWSDVRDYLESLKQESTWDADRPAPTPARTPDVA